MAQLNLKISDERLDQLRRYASRRRTPIAWLLKDYIEYLLTGGPPVQVAERSDVNGHDVAVAAEASGAFNWLADEPELYSPQDGEAV